MIFPFLAMSLGLASPASPSGTDRVVFAQHNDTTFVIVPAGDSATVPLPHWFTALKSPAAGVRIDRNRLCISPGQVGRRDIALRSVLGFRLRLARIETVPDRDLQLRLHPVGTQVCDWIDSSGLEHLRQELADLFGGTGIHPKLAISSPATLPRSPTFWDPEGDGNFDLVRNQDTLQPSSGLDSLSRWLTGLNLLFPDLALLQVPVRVGWSIHAPVAKGDSSLQLGNQATLPWRNAKGNPVHYVLQSISGSNADTFVVVGYDSTSMRIRTTSQNGRWAFDHRPDADRVLRPEGAPPAFGISASLQPGSAPLVILPDARRLEDPVRAARVIAREVCHALGLNDLDDRRNLMSSLLRMEISHPQLHPEQVLRLQESLKSYP